MAINTKITIAATSTSILTQSFRACVLTNTWTDGVVWLKIGETWDAVVWEGIPLVPASWSDIGGSFAMNDPSLYSAPITAISSTWSNDLAVWYV
jgi:hypothetical protein